MYIDKNKSVAFSGHRQLRVSESDLFDCAMSAWEYRDALKDRLRETITSLAAEGYTHFLCGMAMGFDLLAAEAVSEIKSEFPAVKLVAVVPFPRQADRFDTESKLLYEQIMEQADHSVTVSGHYSYDCYHRRNDFLVDNSSVLVCFYNGSKGGTAYTVKRAMKQGHRILNLR